MNDATQFFNTGGGYQIERSLRFNSSDSAYLSRTPSVAGNRKTWTWAGWVKRSKITASDYEFIFGYASGSTYEGLLWVVGSDKLEFWSSPTAPIIQTTQLFRDPSAWFHIVLACDTTQGTASNRVKLYINGSQVTQFDAANYPAQDFLFKINDTIAYNIGAEKPDYERCFNGYLADIHFIDGQALDPTSFGEFDTNGVWQPKAYTGSYGTNGFHLPFSDNSTAAALGTDTSGNGNDWTVHNLSVGKPTVTPPALYSSTTLYTTRADIIANATPRGIGGGGVAGSEYLYLVINNGGQVGKSCFSAGWNNGPRTFYYNGSWTTSGSYGPSEAPSFTYSDDGVWGSYDLDNSGTGGFLLFCDASSSSSTPNVPFVGTIPTLNSSNFNTFQSINTASDDFVDTPTNYGEDTGAGGEVRGNYATLDPLGTPAAYGRGIPSNGNLEFRDASSGRGITSNFAMRSGKWYAEVVFAAQYNSSPDMYPLCGICRSDYHPASLALFPGYDASGIGFDWSGQLRNQGSLTAPFASFTTTDIGMIAYDADTGKVWFGKNGTWFNSGSPSTGANPAATASWYASGAYFAANSAGGTTTASIWNFGQRPFAYPAPSGFKALCTTNLPEPTITDGSKAMDVKLYTGNDSTQTISGLGFSPDLVWIKSRSTGTGHQLYDVVRGTTNALDSSTTGAESTIANGLTAFNADGFTLGNNGGINGTGLSAVAWTWDAGSSTAISNNDGSITSQVRANPSAGFSIMTFTMPSVSSATIGHGLNAAPALYFWKDRDSADSWYTYHLAIGADKYLTLDTAGSAASSPSMWNNTAPTSSVINTGSKFSNTGSTVAYCFAPVDGYSSFGSYTGNGSTDGPFVYTGFRPRWLLVKCSSSYGNWVIFDTDRSGFNLTDKRLFPDSSEAESTIADRGLDITSNGFKVRATHSSVNTSGATYIYAAFAEHPFKYARAR